MAEGAGILPNHEVTHSAAPEASGPESPFPSHSRPHPAHHTPPTSTPLPAVTCPSATARVWGCPAHRRAPPLEDRPGERFATAPEAGPGISERGILGSQVSGMAGNCQIHSCEPRVDPKWTRITRTLVNRFCANERVNRQQCPLQVLSGRTGLAATTPGSTGDGVPPPRTVRWTGRPGGGRLQVAHPPQNGCSVRARPRPAMSPLRPLHWSCPGLAPSRSPTHFHFSRGVSCLPEEASPCISGPQRPQGEAARMSTSRGPGRRR